MFAYLLDAIYAWNAFPSMSWTWTLRDPIVYIYCRVFSDCSHRGVMEKLTDHFLILLYQMIFEEEPRCMSRGEMEEVEDIIDWFPSLDGTFLKILGGQK